MTLKPFNNVSGIWCLCFGTVFGLFCMSCIEEISIDQDIQGSINPENTVVVEGKLTDRIEVQRIILRNAVSFSNDSIIGFNDIDLSIGFIPFYERAERPEVFVTGASVRVTDDSGQQYGFAESSLGNYTSLQPFAAQIGVSYQLLITLANGAEITSEFMQLPAPAGISEFYVERIFNEFGEEGVGFFVDAETTDPNANIRYEFQETYKVIAPNWDELGFRFSNYDPCALPVITYDLEILPREEEQQVCFGTEPSKEIVQFQLEEVSGGSLDRSRVHFISRQDYKIMHRYSMLVEQLVVSTDSYSYYDQLRSFSKSESVFNQIQPGFLEGNLKADPGSNVTVIGYFDVVSVSSQRLFFNFDDLFPGEPRPPYAIPCNLQSVPTEHASFCLTGLNGTDCPQSLVERLNLGLVTYVGTFAELGGGFLSLCPGDYVFVERPCGDCRILGSNVEPDFWIE